MGLDEELFYTAAEGAEPEALMATGILSILWK